MTSKQQELVARTEDEQALEAWKGYSGAIEDGTDDIQPAFPNLKLVQATSKIDGAGRHGGDFYLSSTEQYHETIKVVPIYRRTTRAMFTEGSDAPVCSSGDALRPNSWSTYWEDAGKAMPEFCSQCPLSEWGEDGKPPACRESWNFLLALEDGEIATLRVAGKNLRVWRHFIQRRLKPKNLPLWSHIITLSSVRKEDGQYVWQEMVLDGKLQRPQDAEVYADMLREYRLRFTSNLAAAPAQPEEEWED